LAAERKPGSNLGRAATDWDAAFLSYAALPPDKRGYRAVADSHQVSVRTVERHGRTHNWKARAAAIDREAQNLAVARLAAERAAKIGDVEKLVDATLVYYAGQIRDGKLKMSATDLRRLHELRGELWAEQPLAPAEPGSDSDRSHGADSSERKLEVLRALRDAGVLETTDDHDAGDHGDQGDQGGDVDRDSEVGDHDDQLDDRADHQQELA
jgi:hypothetical protein